MIKLDEIQEKLFAEDDRTFISMRNWHEGYKRGVCEALGRVNDAMREEPVKTDTPQDKPRTNLDRIRAMSAEEMANRIISLDLACEFCPVTTPCFAQKQGGSECRQHIVEWLNSPAKDVVDG